MKHEEAPLSIRAKVEICWRVMGTIKLAAGSVVVRKISETKTEFVEELCIVSSGKSDRSVSSAPGHFPALVV